jgi:hypothetical protein
MANLVEAFINDVRAAESTTHSNRTLVIRHKMTENENFVRGNGGDTEAINSFFQQAKDRAFQEISRHSPNGIPTPTAEFFQQVVDALSTRLRTFIDQAKNGYRVKVSIPGGLPHIAKGVLPSQKAAQDWRDSDLGDTYIRKIVARGD